MKPIKIVNKYIPFKGYMAMLTLFILWIREEYKNKTDLYTLNHETIHMYQQLEILIPSITISLILCSTVLSWWWMTLSVLLPLLIYVIAWIVEIILPPYNSAYKNICFESEAIYNEGNLNYTKGERKLFGYNWIKYISNKKYPYLNHKDRLEIWKKK